MALSPTAGRSADPPPVAPIRTVAYKVDLAKTGDAAMDSAMTDAATLIGLHDTAPVAGFALVARARSDAGRFADVLHSFGYYDAVVDVTIDGRGLDDPGLPDLLDAATAEVPVAIKLTEGPLFHLRHIAVQGDLPASLQGDLGLKPGDPARAVDVLTARQNLLTALQNNGYALAQIDPPAATLVEADKALDVAYAVRSGPQVNLGPISIAGEDRLNESYIRRRLTLQQGQRYDPAAIAAAKSELEGSGAIAGVRIVPADHVDQNGQLPVRIDVSERPLRAVNLGTAFSTDQGGSASASWTQRNLWGNAEQLTLSAGITNLGDTDSEQPGYNVSAQLMLPDWQRRDQTLTFQLAGIKESLEAYDRTALIAGATVSRKLSPRLTVSVGLTAEEAKFVQEDVTRDYSLVQIPLGAVWDTTTSLFDPTDGMRASATVTPSESLPTDGGQTSSFVIAQASAAGYIDMGKLLGGTPTRSVLALRALVGGLEGAGVFDIPPDQRFYAGGGGTIRGYRYQSVGPVFADNKPTGGTSLDVGTIEFRQRFLESWGAAAFVDAGQVGDTGTPFTGDLRVGAGVGARYYTSIGPLRVDFAVPLIKQKGGDSFEFYIGLGQAF